MYRVGMCRVGMYRVGMYRVGMYRVGMYRVGMYGAEARTPFPTMRYAHLAGMGVPAGCAYRLLCKAGEADST